MVSNQGDISIVDKVLNLAIAISSILVASIIVLQTLYIEEKRKHISGNIWAILYRRGLYVIFLILILNIIIGIGAFTYLTYKFNWLYEPIIISFYFQMIFIIIVAYIFIKKK